MKTYGLDLLKGMLVSGVIGGLLLSAVVWFYEWAGSFFWLKPYFSSIWKVAYQSKGKPSSPETSDKPNIKSKVCKTAWSVQVTTQAFHQPKPPVLPENLKGIYDEKEYARFQNYKRETNRFDLISSTFSFIVNSLKIFR